MTTRPSFAARLSALNQFVPAAISQWVAIAIVTLLLCGGARGAVVVQKQPATIATKTFDPAAPPADMPPLAEHEQALTHSVFTATVRPEPSNVKTSAAADGYDATLTVRSMRVTINLKLTVWVPKEVTAKLKAHENGHKQIVEQVWATAEKRAKEAGDALLGQEFSGHGKSAREASTDALRQAAMAFEKAYTPLVSDQSAAVNSIYDDLTEHGVNDVPEAQATKQAFERYNADHPESKANPGTAKTKS